MQNNTSYAAALEAAAEAVQRERLTGEAGTSDDAAYNRAIDHAVAAIRALPFPQEVAPAVRVKPLEWVEYAWLDGTETRKAPFGWKAEWHGTVYRIKHHSGMVLEDEKAAKQKEHAHRIMSAIEVGHE